MELRGGGFCSLEEGMMKRKTGVGIVVASKFWNDEDDLRR